MAQKDVIVKRLDEMIIKIKIKPEKINKVFDSAELQCNFYFNINQLPGTKHNSNLQCFCSQAKW